MLPLPRWSLNRKPAPCPCAEPLKDQCMFKHHSLLPALAGLLFIAGDSIRADQIHQDFSSDPALSGWRTFGHTNLFARDSTNQNLRVTWDSSKTNSYFLHPLGTVLAKDDDFNLAFELKLDDIAIGVDPNKPYTFQIAVGFINTADATRANFLRGTGVDSPNLVELDYFPDSGFGATISPVLISRSNDFAYAFHVAELFTNVLYRVSLNYTASNQALATVITSNGVPIGPIADAVLGTNFSDFRLDAVAVCSYSDAGQDPIFAGSILAHGAVDNIVVTVPEPPVRFVSGSFTNDAWRVTFKSDARWFYTLERSADFNSWTNASPDTPGNNSVLMLNDTNPPAAKAFYRVAAQRP